MSVSRAVWNSPAAPSSGAKLQGTLSTMPGLSKFFLLNYCTEHKTRRQIAWMVFRIVAFAAALGCLNFYTLYIKIRDYYEDINLSIKLTDAIQMCYDYLQYYIDLYFVFKHGGSVLKYYKQYANIDIILGITDYSPIKSKLVKLIGIFIVIWFVSSALDFSTWLLTYGLYLPTLYSVSYIFFAIKMINNFALTSHVMQIEFRLKYLKNRLQECYLSTRSLPKDTEDPFCDINWCYNKSSSLKSPRESEPVSEQILVGRATQPTVKWLSRCYLLLIEQCVFINNMFGMRILLNSLSLLIDMIRYTNIAVRLILGSQETAFSSGYYPAAANLVRMATCVLVVASLVTRCERAYRQADGCLAVIDHTLVTKDPDGELKAALSELRGLLQSRRIDFHMAHFLRLDFSLLVSMASVVVTYTIILLQSLPK